MRAARSFVATVAVAAGLFAVPSVVTATVVGPCLDWDDLGYCIEWEVPTPGQPGNPGNPGGGGGGGSSCYWRNLGIDLGRADPTIFVDFGIPDVPPGVEVVWQEWHCPDGQVTFNFRWVIPAEPPTPGELASTARGRLVGRMPEPVVNSSPASGVASVVGVPSFVEVGNWTGELTDSECAGGLCVTVTARPALTWSSGEPEAGTIACAGAGSRFEPNGGSPDTQAAADGACAWAYTMRTGVDGRPTAWDGSVSVTWSISWTASSGASGTLPAVTRTAAVPRSVAEVQTVVVGGVTP